MPQILTVKKLAPIISILIIFSVIAGYLFSKASLIGHVGISLFYKQYKFLKVWWQGALVVFCVLLFILIIQAIVNIKTTSRTAQITHTSFLILGVIGLYFTYLDFGHSLSHHMLGERFHLGAYLFWMGWIIVCLYYLLKRKRLTT
ncbi:MAG: cytochrome d ubiquinol oxidase subunit II [Chitinophagaceae bacterium]